ncbi:MAG: recombinase family protein [Bacteroidales bacterium]
MSHFLMGRIGQKSSVLYPQILNMEVAIYARVSTTSKQETENQLVVLREFCNKLNHSIYEEYVDHESGASSTRPQFQRMFIEASKRKFDMVLFWSLDRFTREGVRKTIFYLQQLEDYHVLYRSYSEPYLDTSGAFKDVVISLLAMMASQERIRMSERVKAGLERTRKLNGKVGGRPKVSSQIVLQIEELHEQGISMRQIGRQLRISHRTVGGYLSGHQDHSAPEPKRN